MKTSSFSLTLVLVIFLVGASLGFAATFYVNQNHPAADDSNEGTDPDFPWLTLKHATMTAVAGDTVIVKEGLHIDFTGESFNPAHVGTENYPIVFLSDPPLAAVVQSPDWEDESTTPLLAWVICHPHGGEKTHVVIDGFVIHGDLRSRAGHHVTVSNCRIYLDPDDPGPPGAPSPPVLQAY